MEDKDMTVLAILKRIAPDLLFLLGILLLCLVMGASSAGISGAADFKDLYGSF